MMKKRIVSIVSILLVVSVLSGCGMLTDDTNYNFPKGGIVITNEDGSEIETGVFHNKNNNAEVYYDVSAGMKGIVSDSKTQGIVQDSVDAITKAWSDDISTTVYSIGANSIDVMQSISDINNLSAISYGGNADDIVTRAIENKIKSGDKVVIPRIKLIITDLRGQLNKYQDLATEISDKVFKNKESVAILSVNTKEPFFIFAIGALNDLSEYLDKFYAMPNVRAFSGAIDWVGADRTYNINCKIYAQNSGIEGINYDAVNLVENGQYAVNADGTAVKRENKMQPGEMPSMGQPNGDMSAERPNGEPPSDRMPGPKVDNSQELPDGNGFKEETKGSVEILRPDYKPDDLDTVEGTVNFFAETDFSVEPDTPKGVDEKDISQSDIRYFGYKSMLWNKADILKDNNPIAGKIKLTVPFNVMSQIQLSNLKFKVETKYSDTPRKSSSKFADSDQVVKDNIKVSFANNESDPHINEWRINNQDKTAMINININDLTQLSKVTKLDIVFGAYDPGTMPLWVQEWTKKDGLRNLYSFVSQLNDYNMSNNEFSEQLTIYIAGGDRDSYESVKKEPLNET